jgi:ferredoxin
MAVARVWIEGECTICNACEGVLPEVFHVTDETCHIVLPHLKPENPFAGKFLTEDVRHDPKTPPF